MAPSTNGFGSLSRRRSHFAKHGAEVGASDAEDYERLADELLGSVKPPEVHECKRSKGDLVRYDPRTEVFGVVDAAGVIRTYFKPIPCSKVPFHLRAGAKRRGECHGFLSNLHYFQAECKKW